MTTFLELFFLIILSFVFDSLSALLSSRCSVTAFVTSVAVAISVVIASGTVAFWAVVTAVAAIAAGVAIAAVADVAAIAAVADVAAIVTTAITANCSISLD